MNRLLAVRVAIGLAACAVALALTASLPAALLMPPPIAEGTTCWVFHDASVMRAHRHGWRVGLARRDSGLATYETDEGTAFFGGRVWLFGELVDVSGRGIAIPGHSAERDPFRGPVPCSFDRPVVYVFRVADGHLKRLGPDRDEDLIPWGTCAAVDWPKTARRWLCADGSEVTVDGPTMGQVLSVTPASRIVADPVPTPNAGVRVVYDVPAWRVTLDASAEGTAFVAVAPDGGRTALGTVPGRCALAEVATRAVLEADCWGFDGSHWAEAVDWSGGKLVATGSGGVHVATGTLLAPYAVVAQVP